MAEVFPERGAVRRQRVQPSEENVAMKNLGSFPTRSTPTRSTFILILLCAGLVLAAPAQTFTSLADLNGSDGANPRYNGLVQGTDGNFYGTAFEGGTYGRGSVYRVTADGTLSLLYAFCSRTQCSDGAQPEGPLLLGADGNFYGTTSGGGATNYGTFFKLTPTGTLTTLYSFCPQLGCHDGTLPTGPLVQGFDGNFYGTTAGGGGASGRGIIFKITPTGILTAMHNFCSLSKLR
jgi:uncharacterized repeat protein (TIGR03803 family)